MALDPNAFNDNKTEEQAVIDHAYALASCLEAATSFAYVVERYGFTESVQEDFTKKLQRTLDSLLSSVPNQWKERVLKTMNDAAKQAAEDEAKERAITSSPITEEEKKVLAESEEAAGGVDGKVTEAVSKTAVQDQGVSSTPLIATSEEPAPHAGTP